LNTRTTKDKTLNLAPLAKLGYPCLWNDLILAPNINVSLGPVRGRPSVLGGMVSEQPLSCVHPGGALVDLGDLEHQ
jgi:hypothetical protein